MTREQVLEIHLRPFLEYAIEGLQKDFKEYGYCKGLCHQADHYAFVQGDGSIYTPLKYWLNENRPVGSGFTATWWVMSAPLSSFVSINKRLDFCKYHLSKLKNTVNHEA